MIKRKTALSFIGVLGLGVLIAAAVAIAVFNSQPFHRYLLSKIIEKASQANGGKVEIGDYRFHLPSLRVEFDHIVLHGTESGAHAPLLEIDHVLVGLKILSLWRREISLSEIVVDHPVIHFSVDANGQSNLPHPPAASGAGNATSIFDLAIGRFVVNRGQLDYNDRRVPLAGDVRDLHAKVDFDSSKTEYDGELSYQDGRLQIGNFNPIVHGMEAKFGANPAGLKIGTLNLRSGNSSVSLQGQLRNYENPSVEGTYHGSVSTRELGEILKSSSMPVGQVDLKGTIRYQDRAGSPVLKNVATDGDFRSATLAINLPQAHANIRGITGTFYLHDGTLEVKNARGSLLGGNASGRLTMANLTDTPAATVTAELHGISLAAASSALNSQALERTAISGTLNGSMKGSWQGAGRNLRIHADATIAAETAGPVERGPEQAAIPVQGELHATYDDPSGTITLQASRLSTPHTTVMLDGTAGKQSSLALQMHSDDLHEVDELALIARRAFSSDEAAPSAQFQPFGLGGSGSFVGQLRGSGGEYQLSGQVSSTNFKFHNAALNLLHANVAITPAHISISQGQLRAVDGGQVNFDLAADLANWSYKPQNSVQLDLTASDVHVDTIEQAANLHYPVTGVIAAHATLRGTPADLHGQGAVTLTNGVAWEQPYQTVDAQFEVTGENLRTTLQIATPAGSGSGNLTYNFPNQGYDVQMSLPSLQLDQLTEIQKKDLPISGVVNATLQGKGTLKSPQFTATVVAPTLKLGNQSLNGFQVRTSVMNQRANFVVASAASGALIQANGTVTLNGNYPIEATVDMKNISLGAMLAEFYPQVSSAVGGQSELHATLRGPLRERAQLVGEINVPKLSLSYESLQIANVAPIHAAFRGGVVSIDRFELKGTGTDIKVQAALPLGRDQNLQAAANGEADLHLVQLLLPRWDGSGQVHMDVNAAGTRSHPNLNGTIRLIKASVEAPDSPIGAENVNGVITLKNGRVDIQSIKGEAGGGTFTAQGFATYQPGVQYNIGLTARKVRLRYPLGTRTVLDGKLVLTGTRDSGLLSGQLVIDRLSLTKDFDLATFADQFGTISTPTSGPSFAQNVKVNVSLKSAREMALASSKLSVQGSADLTIRGTASEPVLLGRSDITGGEIFFGGNRYIVENGVVQFVNPVQTEPVVNILVTTTIDQFNLSMNFVGPLDRLRTTYTSDPPLAPVDIINLLTTGRTTEAASTGQTSPESVIAGQLTQQFSSRVEKLAGVTSLTIDPQVGGAQGDSGGRLAIQQRVTKNLYFTFSTDLRTSTGQIVQVEYQVSKRFALSTTRDQDGGYTVQVKIHKRF